MDDGRWDGSTLGGEKGGENRVGRLSTGLLGGGGERVEGLGGQAGGRVQPSSKSLSLPAPRYVPQHHLSGQANMSAPSLPSLATYYLGIHGISMIEHLKFDCRPSKVESTGPERGRGQVQVLSRLRGS